MNAKRSTDRIVLRSDELDPSDPIRRIWSGGEPFSSLLPVPADAGGFRRWLTAGEIFDLTDLGRTYSKTSIYRYLRQIRTEEFSHLWRGASPLSIGDGRRARVIERSSSGTEYYFAALPPETIARYESDHRPRPTQKRKAIAGSAAALFSAEGGVVRGFMLNRLAFKPGIKAERLRTLCIQRFGRLMHVPAGEYYWSLDIPSANMFHYTMTVLRREEQMPCPCAKGRLKGGKEAGTGDTGAG